MRPCTSALLEWHTSCSKETWPAAIATNSRLCPRRLPARCAVQGEVEQISMMKPKGQTEHETGLLEYLEDIVGTDKYIPLLEESAKR